MKKRVLLALTIFLFPLHTFAVLVKIISANDIANTFTISESGLYVLGADSSIANGIAITITTSDVTLDLSNRSIRGTGAHSGVSINSNVSNIVIKNGTIIGDFSTYGVFVDGGVQNLILEELTVSGTSNDSLSFNCLYLNGGTPKTSHVLVNSCWFNNSQIGLFADQADDLFLENSSFNNNGTGITASSCNNCYLKNCHISDNTTASSDTSYGMSLSQASCWTIQNSDFNFNQNTLRGTGLYIVNSRDIIIEDNTFLDNGSSGGSSTSSEGINLSSSSSCIVRHCIANGNFSSTGTTSGVKIDGSSSNGHVLEMCTANNNVTLTAAINAYGFFIDDSVSNININCCSAGTNRSISALGAGYFVASTATNCLIQNSHAYFNSNYGAIVNSTTAFLLNNSFIGHAQDSITGQGTFDTVDVFNGAQPPSGTFDEKAVSNLAVRSILA